MLLLLGMNGSVTGCFLQVLTAGNDVAGGSNTVSGYGPWKNWAKTSGAKLLPTFPAAAKDTGTGYQVNAQASTCMSSRAC